MKADQKPYLTFDETLAALRFAANPNVSKHERRFALSDVWYHLEQFPDYEIHVDGFATVLFQAPDGNAIATTIPPLRRDNNILDFQL